MKGVRPGAHPSERDTSSPLCVPCHSFASHRHD